MTVPSSATSGPASSRAAAMTAADLPPPTAMQRPDLGFGGRCAVNTVLGSAAAMAVTNKARRAARAVVSFQLLASGTGGSCGIDDFLRFSAQRIWRTGATCAILGATQKETSMSAPEFDTATRTELEAAAF